MLNNRQATHYLIEPIAVAERTWEEDAIPLVSISCITYNHAPYIGEAIDSFLAQKINFSVEILLHDDASTDGTTDIIREYEKRYPNLIFPIYQTKNQFSNGIRISFAYQFPRARGKYIALCDGDDYWIDPLKLQKQVDFLETNPEFSGASHQSLMVFSNKKNNEPIFFREHCITEIEVDHLLDGRLFHTSSLTFRSEITKMYPPPTDITSGDRALFFILATFGKIHYSDEAMCCYRKHTGGISNWVTVEMLEKDFKIVPWISKINPDFPAHRYYKFLHLVALRYPSSLSILKIIRHSLLYVYHWLFIRPHDLHDLRVFVTHQFPSFIAKAKNIL